MKKPPPHSLYAKLTEDQRAQLYDWILTLGYPKTKERIALAEPEGFGITTHLSCLHRFYVRYIAELDTEHVSEAEQVNGPSPARLFPLAEQAAHAGAFRLTTAPLDSDSFGKLSQWVSTQQANQLKRDYIRIAEHNAVIAQKKAALAESRLELDREKFRFNAARHALIHFAELAKIARNRDADNEAKIRATADLLFQPAQNTSPMPAPPLRPTDQRGPSQTGGPTSFCVNEEPDTEPCSSRGHETHDNVTNDFHVVPNQSSILDCGTTPLSPGQSRLPVEGGTASPRPSTASEFQSAISHQEPVSLTQDFESSPPPDFLISK